MVKQQDILIKDLKTKYFTSKKFTDEEKYNMSLEYLNSYNMNAVQRLNGNGWI